LNRSSFGSLTFPSVFVVLLALAAAWLQPYSLSRPLSALAGLLAGVFATAIALHLRRSNARALLTGLAGALLGLGVGLLAVFVLRQASLVEGQANQFLRLAVPLVGAYMGLLVGVAHWNFFPVVAPLATPERTVAGAEVKLLDTSVLIDGRIADIAESGFVEGKLVVPRFVLHELQSVADSSDSARRNRGRRGLDVVQRLQKMPGLSIEVSPQDFPAVREVDLKLIEVAKLLNAKIVTNDFNLNKLAQVQGLRVLNINELANSLKPVVLPGESMRLFILKEGKEHNQGIAYLDDGTMVVVDNARRMISKTVDVTVTSVLQTTAGKMIFGRYEDRPHGSSEPPRSNAASVGTSGT
jgi:uncharacterized protein YacL